MTSQSKEYVEPLPSAETDVRSAARRISGAVVARVTKPFREISKKVHRLRVIYYNPELYSLYLYDSTGSEPDEYNKWYFNKLVWHETTWMGIECYKSVSDMWNYQEILHAQKPALVIEFGTFCGGSARFFASVMREIGQPFKILSVDIDHARLKPEAQQDPDVIFMESSSTADAVADRIRALKKEYPGKIFAILDSDHSKDHVLAEMKALRPLLSAGDYLVVEDSVLNGHPVAPGWGPGPYEAIEAYEAEFPNDYIHDQEREEKFGWTWAPRGYLVRR
ncbi:rhamnosyl O-methyltransferase [Mycolicibacterium parafortuitum]|uniref:Rhamnosyl O-methyltransferase n=1 Tax=Mycolicibacterium parafortuitum TaxID=39692 RepID=A0A7I7U853_MYCPF|nr:CmcI family methyltransferase [Mycolicibacterium parafortuitum]BBY77255.1 rhamnosyl O-methyltransferase [Mycolicibacterium parafortuitum]